MADESIIKINGLEVRYGSLIAVAGISMAVRRGEIFGLLGPNGAGKSTILACIEGLRRPSGGSVKVAGHDVVRDPVSVKQLLGVQLQKSALFSELNIRELVELYAALYNVFLTTSEIRVLLERYGLAQKAKARTGQLSGGQQQRLTLALAVVNDPQIVLLDEPTTGLDPQARRGVWSLIRQMRSEGRTVLLTTHYMEEAQELCDRVGIVEAGKLVALDTPQTLIQRYARALPPEEAHLRQPDLEDVFLTLTGRGLATSAASQVPDDDAEWLVRTA